MLANLMCTMKKYDNDGIVWASFCIIIGVLFILAGINAWDITHNIENLVFAGIMSFFFLLMGSFIIIVLIKDMKS